jgi:hypothetical protein
LRWTLYVKTIIQYLERWKIPLLYSNLAPNIRGNSIIAHTHTRKMLIRWKRMQFMLFYSALVCRRSKKVDIIEAEHQEQQCQQVWPVDATLHPQQQILVSASATTKEDPGVVGHCGLPGKCR